MKHPTCYKCNGPVAYMQTECVDNRYKRIVYACEKCQIIITVVDPDGNQIMTDIELTIETQAADLYVNLEQNRNRIQIHAGIHDNVSMILTNEELFRLVRFVQEHLK